MPEYQLARFILGLAQLALALAIRKYRVGYLFWFAIFLWWSAAVNIAPSFPRSEFYKYFVQIPAYLISLALTVASTLDVFRFLPRRTFPQERRLLLAFSVVAGLLPVAAGWIWRATNGYQAVMIGRQYVLLAVTVAFWTAWIYLHHLRPLSISPVVRMHMLGWGWWLLSATGLAATTKGGLLWQVLQWPRGSWTWRALSVYLILAQLLILWRMSVNLRSWPVVSPDDEGGSRIPEDELPCDPARQGLASVAPLDTL